MSATLDWSYDLLSAPEKALFRDLSVFAGGFSMAAAEAVHPAGDDDADDVLHLLGELVGQSLVAFEALPDTNDDEPRYGMLEPVRQYAGEKLEESGESATASRRHATFFQDLHRKLTLICDPAGFGKSTLISEWLAGCEMLAAWLSLDEGDNDPTRFVAYPVAALQTVKANIGEGVLGGLQSPRPPPTESVLTPCSTRSPPYRTISSSSSTTTTLLRQLKSRGRGHNRAGPRGRDVGTRARPLATRRTRLVT
jgi:hypothetical protein